MDSSNKLLPYARVYIIPAEDKRLPQRGQGYSEGQGKNGFFKFVHIPPGKYLIVVNPEDAQRPDFPYHRAFYPGVHDRETATILTIRGGEQIKDADIRLKQQFAPRHVSVRVTWADGLLVSNFVSIEARGIANPSALSDANQPDMKQGVIDLNILPEEPYELEAKLVCRYADERSQGPGAMLKSNKVSLSPRDEQKEVILTIPANACPEILGKTLLTEHQ